MKHNSVLRKNTIAQNKLNDRTKPKSCETNIKHYKHVTGSTTKHMNQKNVVIL